MSGNKPSDRQHGSGNDPLDASGIEQSGKTAYEEGGEIGEFEETYPLDPRRHRERTAAWLAAALLAVFAGSFFLHYTVLAFVVAEGANDLTQRLSDVFNAWLPVVSGLFGSAVTYYFTHQRR